MCKRRCFLARSPVTCANFWGKARQTVRVRDRRANLRECENCRAPDAICRPGNKNGEPHHDTPPTPSTHPPPLSRGQAHGPADPAESHVVAELSGAERHARPRPQPGRGMRERERMLRTRG